MVFFARVFQKLNADPKPIAKEKKKPKPIPKESAKRKIENKAYKTLRKVYLENHPFCEVKMKGCTKKATEIHHDQGRGIKLNDVESFVAICRSCHMLVEEKNIKVKSVSK